MEFKDKFIGFVDILGFKGLVAAAEKVYNPSLSELMGWTTKLGSAKDKAHLIKYGPTICPGSPRVSRGLDFEITQISDCVVVSSEISPAGVVNLVHHCWGAVVQLLMHGLMCRGYITRGSIYHENGQFIGTGYQNAYEKESQVAAFKNEANERGTPFVEVDSIVVDYVAGCEDWCTKEMFSRYVKTDGNVTALFPFQRLSHSFILAGFGVHFDPAKEKESNNNMRLGIQRMRDQVLVRVDSSNPGALSKAQHYVRALNAQLELCDRTDKFIDGLASPYPRRR